MTLERHDEFWRLFADWWGHLDGGWQVFIVVMAFFVVARLFHDNDSDVARLRRRCDKLEADKRKLRSDLDALRRKVES